MIGHRIKHISRLLLSYTLLLFYCQKSFEPAAADSNALSTLESLQQIDEVPVYTMTYRGDYGFSQYLKTGVMQPPAISLLKPKEIETWSCSCFAALSPDAEKIFGRNFDWHDRAILILFTDSPDGHASVSMANPVFFGYSADPKLNSINDRERLLSAPYFSLDGMNEKGVAIGLMAIPTARSPYDPSKITIGELQVIRLVLDYAATVQEAVQLIGRYNVRMDQPPVHYLIADREGRSVVVELINGSMQVIQNMTPWQISTNFILAGSKVLSDYRQADCWRYKILYSELDQTGGKTTAEQGMQLLQAVSQSSSSGGTMWSAVYNLSTGQMLFVPGRKYDSVKTFTLKMTP